MLQAYYASVAYQDYNIGRVLTELDAIGQVFIDAQIYGPKHGQHTR